MGDHEAELAMTWAAMISRCYHKKHKNYPGYGARGINVCLRWHSFLNFIEDMGQRPDGHTLDRINNDGNYEPDNCRWATITQQNRNKSDNVHLTIDGNTKLMIDWSRQSGVSSAAISVRLKLGWDHKDAVFRPVRKKKPNRKFLTCDNYAQGDFDGCPLVPSAE